MLRFVVDCIQVYATTLGTQENMKGTRTFHDITCLCMKKLYMKLLRKTHSGYKALVKTEGSTSLMILKSSLCSSSEASYIS